MDLIKKTPISSSISSSVSYAVEIALDKLLGVNSFFGDGDDPEVIKLYLASIKSDIGSTKEYPLKDPALVAWLKKLEDAAYYLEDVLDESSTHDLGREVEAKNSYPVTNKVRKIASSISIYPVLNRIKMTYKRKKIIKRLESIKERHKSKRKELIESVKKWEDEFKKGRETTSKPVKPEVYGRDEDKGKIVNLLLRPIEGDNNEKVSVIPIVGMGGQGKTTLAQLVYNDDEVQSHFDLKMWVWVSPNFDDRRIIEKIVRRATGHNPESQLDLEDLQHRLQGALTGKRFLLVLDDVWIEESEHWERLRVLSMCGKGGSRIVVTTRTLMTASLMSKIKPYILESLLEEDCWKLFARWAFDNDDEKNHLNLVDIGMEIVKKCRGVPMAAVTMGQCLRFKREKSYWVFVKDAELTNLAVENECRILHTLRLSYYHLNPHLRQCFAFCAVFPKGYKMNKELLIQLWMANGFLPSSGRKELEDIGTEILNELLRRSLFQEVKDDGGDDSLKIKVHDLLHDVAQSIVGNDCCIIECGKLAEDSKRVRHLFVHQRNSPGDILNEAQSLRTLLVLGSDFEVPSNMAISKCLRVLHLERSSLLPLLTSLGQLMHLRYFKLECPSIEILPDSVSSLLNLQTLKLDGCVSLRELPKGTRNLINLRCLDIIGCDSLSHMPEKIGKLSCLRKMTLFVVGDSASVCSGIEELQCLKLRGNLIIDHLERLAIPSNAKEAKLIEKTNLDRLQLRWRIPENTQKREDEEEILKGLQPHANLKELEIIGYGGICFPDWMTSISCSIVKITLKGCRRCGLLPPLGQLPLLKFLHIECMNGVEKIGSEFYGNDMGKVFPSLETLEIAYMSSLKEWSGLHGERVFSLSALQTLSIMSCDKLAELPDELPCLTSLQILKISECTNLKSLREGMIGSLSSLKELSLEHVGLTSLPTGINNLTSLQRLELCLPSLTSLQSMQELQSTLTLDIIERTSYSINAKVHGNPYGTSNFNNS